MSYTTLGFYRQEQTLESLKTERPQSLDCLRSILNSSIEDLDRTLKTYEDLYYDGMTCEAHIRHILPAFRECMNIFQVQIIHSSWQIDDITRRCEKHVGQYGLDNEGIAHLRDFTARIKAFIPMQFERLINDVREIMRYAQKYCLSFYVGKKDNYLDTTYHYTMARQEYIGAIKLHLNQITNMSKSFRQGGLSMRMFGSEVKEIGRKSGCKDIPVLLVFPEACANIRLALQILSRWLGLDGAYNTFLYNDLVEITKKRRAQDRAVRECQRSSVLLDHQMKITIKEVAQLKEQLVRLQPKASEMETDLNRLVEDINDLKTDITLKEEENNELRRSRNTAAGDDVTANAGDVTRLKLTILVLQRQLEQRRGKMGIILEKRNALETKQALVKRLEKMKVKAKTELHLARHEFDRMERAYETLKNILKLRRSPDITSKIFRNLPLEGRNSRMSPVRRRVIVSADGQAQSQKRDALERAFDIVAEQIGSDWVRLYRTLAFFPVRGQDTLDADINDIVQGFYRCTAEVQAREALARWRRVHAHSSLVDLERGIKVMQRNDILRKLQKIEFPRNPPGDNTAWSKFRKTIQAMHMFLGAKQHKFSVLTTEPVVGTN